MDKCKIDSGDPKHYSDEAHVTMTSPARRNETWSCKYSQVPSALRKTWEIEIPKIEHDMHAGWRTAGQVKIETARKSIKDDIRTHSILKVDYGKGKFTGKCHPRPYPGCLAN